MMTILNRHILVSLLCAFAYGASAQIVKTALYPWNDPGEEEVTLINGKEYPETVAWHVTLKAGTVGSLFDDPGAAPEVFRYETVVTVDGWETLVIPGGTWSSNMGDSTYTEPIPLKKLGLFEPEALGMHYLTAYTRNYSGSSTVSTGYSIITEDLTLEITREKKCDPEKYQLGIEVDHDKTHPDGVMLSVSGKLPLGMTAKIERDGSYLTSITQQGFLFDYIEPSSNPKTYNYTIKVEPKCSTTIERSTNGTPGKVRLGRMSITNENYKALVVKYEQPKNLTVEFTDAKEFAEYRPLVVSRIRGSSSVPVPGELEEQELEGKFECSDSKIYYTIDNKLFEEGHHGDYTFENNGSTYKDREVEYEHVIPRGPKYEDAFSRVLFMRDDYVGLPNAQMSLDARIRSNMINWFEYWKRDGTVDMLKTAPNVRFGCTSFGPNSKAHSGFHEDEGGIHWVCLGPTLSEERTPRFTLTSVALGTSVTVGSGLDITCESTMATPSNSCHQIAATITHELQHRYNLKKWFEDVGLDFDLYGRGDVEGQDESSGFLWWSSYRRKLFGGEFQRIVNDVDRDYAGKGTISDHLSDDTEDKPSRLEWSCKQSAEFKTVLRNLKFDKTNRDTYNIAHHDPEWSSYAGYGDNEVCARLSERFFDEGGVHTNRDWSVKNIGMLTIGQGACSVSPSANAIAANGLMGAGGNANENKAEAVAERSSARSYVCSYAPEYEVPEDMRLFEISAEPGYGVAEEGEGYFSVLRFDVSLRGAAEDLESLTNGEYYAKGYIADDTGRVIACASPDAVLAESGEAKIAFEYDGKILYNARGSGYVLAAVKVERGGLTDIDMPPVACVTNVAACVRSFDYSEFARPDVVMDVAGYAEEWDGTNILITARAEVNAPGEYTIYAQLATTNDVGVGSIERAVEFVAGTNTLTLAFPGEYISRLGLDGPYKVRFLRISSENGDVAAMSLDPYVTSREWTAEELRPDGDGTSPEYVKGSAAWGEVYDDDDANVALEYGFMLKNLVGRDVEYAVESVLERENGEVVGHFTASITAARGLSQQSLTYPVSAFGESGMAGRFLLRSVRLTPVGGAYETIELGRSKPTRDFTPEEFEVKSGFAQSEVEVAEGETLVVGVHGGSAEEAASVDVYLTYATATAADVDLGKMKFPRTLSWAAGEIGEKTISIPVKTDKAVEGDEFFTLQLANAKGMALGDKRTCNVTVNDSNTYVTLQDGLLNHNIKVETRGTAAWLVESGSPVDKEDQPPLYHMRSPELATGGQTTLRIGPVKGRGNYNFAMRFIGDENEEVPSRLDIYDGKNHIGFIDHSTVTNEWHYFAARLRTGTGSTSHTLDFVYTQGSDSATHVEISDTWWDDSGTASEEVYEVYVSANDPAGGYAGGAGNYYYGEALKLVAKPNPGWTFMGWYEAYEDEETGESSYFLWTTKATASYKVNRDGNVVAFFSKIPYIHALAEPADGGKVSGSGLCAEGKKVTLKATQNKGCVFRGWKRASDGEIVATTPTLVVDRTARPAANSKTSTTLTGEDEDETFYACFITASEDRAAIAFALDGIDWDDSSEAGARTNYCGVAVDWPIAASGLSAVTVKAAGLPSGLKLVEDKATGAYSVTGVPSAESKMNAKTGLATPSRVKFTVTTAGGNSRVFELDMVILPLPAWACGTFTGFATDAGGECGFATLTVSAKGAASGKVSLAGSAWTFKATSYAAVECAAGTAVATNFILSAEASSGKEKMDVTLGVAELANSMGFANAIASGMFGEGEAELWRGGFAKESPEAKRVFEAMAGVYTVSLHSGEDYGSGYLSLTVAKDGNVKAAGKLADGTSLSVSAPLLLDSSAQWFTILYAAPSQYKGGAFWMGTAFPESKGTLAPVFESSQWISKNPEATGEYGAGFSRTLDFTGAYYNSLQTLHDYYESLKFSLSSTPELGYSQKWTYFDENGKKTSKTLPGTADAVDLLGEDGITVAVDAKGALVVVKSSRPVQDKKTKEWLYEGENDGALTLSFTKATGIFKGSYTFWFDYESAKDDTTGRNTPAHASKKVTFEGVAVQGASSLDGFYLWDATGEYQDAKTRKTKSYKYKISYPVSLGEL